MNLADSLDQALDLGGSGPRVPPSVMGLLEMAAEVADALAAVHLSRADRDRIYARSLAMLESAVNDQRRGWQRALRRRRPPPLLLSGAAALTIGAAAIGWAVLHGRRSHGPVAA